MRKAVRVLAGGLTTLVLVAWGTRGLPTQAQTSGVPVDPKSISGVVVNGQATEAGVWVIAETDSLPTKFRRIVVTDDQGRFLVPDLPDASYRVWVRGYGLRDSKPVPAARGQQVTLAARSARTPQEAAKIYPANYWLSIYQPPAKEQLPSAYPTREHWVGQVKLDCMLCHQLGVGLTRLWTKPEDWEHVWSRMEFMQLYAKSLGIDPLKQSLADWASRIEAGEVPSAPPRPTGIERNVVVSQWDWGREDSYIHDEITTDKRNPTLYAYGKVWGLDIGQSILWELDPVKHTVKANEIPMRTGPGRSPEREGRYHGNTSSHNPMLDDKGNVWITTKVRGRYQPTWARSVIVDVNAKDASGEPVQVQLEGESDQPAEEGGSRQLGYYDTKAGKFVLIDTPFSTHHLQFDWQGRLWTSGDMTGLGMFDPSKFDPSKPEATEAGAQTYWVKRNAQTGRSEMGGGYGIVVSPVDGTVWRAMYPGGFAAPLPNLRGNRIDMFDPKTKTFKEYQIPLPGYGPRGIDATTDGKMWFATGSGHLGRFDPKTEKFTYWETPGPKIKSTGKETGSADFHYYIWVDQFNIFGLGKDMVIVNGTNSDSLLVFDPAKEQWTVLRIPYPIGMFTRGLDGRIDDAQTGWKGRGIWVANNIDPLTFSESKMGVVNQIQLRPDPLAK